MLNRLSGNIRLRLRRSKSNALWTTGSEPLEMRIVPAITFDVTSGLLEITFDTPSTLKFEDLTTSLQITVNDQNQTIGESIDPQSLRGLIVNGSSGNDFIDLTNLTQYHFRQFLADTCYGNGGNDTVFSAEGPDFIDGGDGDDSLFGFDGNDILSGGMGNDRVFGGSDNDSLLGGAGADFLNGDDGDDYLLGQGTSGDTLVGDVGDDVLNGGAGIDIVQEDTEASLTLTDSLLTGVGHDVLKDIESAQLRSSGTNIVLDASSFTGNATLDGGPVDVTVMGGPGSDSLFGGDGHDLILGNGGNDVLEGNDGDDTLRGGTGNDFLSGSNGDDTLNGGDGNDLLNGGLGNDALSGYTGTDR